MNYELFWVFFFFRFPYSELFFLIEIRKIENIQPKREWKKKQQHDAGYET
jgi:hypothetical protein